MISFDAEAHLKIPFFQIKLLSPDTGLAPMSSFPEPQSIRQAGLP